MLETGEGLAFLLVKVSCSFTMLMCEGTCTCKRIRMCGHQRMSYFLTKSYTIAIKLSIFLYDPEFEVIKK